jgi:menaquinone-9 beta-reductase
MRYESIVVGAGPAGSTTAIELARRGQQVLLLDAARFPRRKACAEYISPGGAAILDRLGVLATIGGRWLDGMQILSPGGASHLVSYGDAAGKRQGLSVTRETLDAGLVDLARRQGVQVREGCRVAAVIQEQGRVSGVQLVNGETITGRMVVGADGLHSVVARVTGLPRRARWPRRLGVVAHLRDVAWPEHYGQMCVGPGGYVGVAPLDGDGTITVGVVRKLPAHGPASQLFDSALRDYPQLAERLRCGTRVDSVMGVGPMARRVRATAGPGWLLVGDAAGFFDPFTGEGIFRALRGAELAADYVHRVLTTSGEDPDSYSRHRQRVFAAKERLTHIVQVFVQVPPLLELALRRLQQRPHVALRLGNMLGDLEPAQTRIVAQLLAS